MMTAEEFRTVTTWAAALFLAALLAIAGGGAPGLS